ncbi:MAG TPA: tryptophan synthase subunit alpha [Candidatus Limnocylindria bacterium]|nr:tryptophan synthase subunit alpha [Candidatus Limnocylindria bacterium]
MTPPHGPAAISEAFAAVNRAGRAALVAYLMAGYPDEETAVAAAESALEAGADLLEVGVPFSDPVADGAVIAEAGRRALERDGGLDAAVRMVARLRARGASAPILAMSYLNPVVARGDRRTLLALVEAGADGLIVPDLPAGEDPAFERLAAHLGLAICFLVAPNTSAERLERAIGATTGFLYVVPLFGVTGVRNRLADAALPLLRRARAVANGRVPIAAGFGISRPEQVAALASVADAVVVGSALVAALGDGGPQGVGELVRDLAAATRVSPTAAPAAR